MLFFYFSYKWDNCPYFSLKKYKNLKTYVCNMVLNAHIASQYSIS